jgi:hypothetical protein
MLTCDDCGGGVGGVKFLPPGSLEVELLPSG